MKNVKFCPLISFFSPILFLFFFLDQITFNRIQSRSQTFCLEFQLQVPKLIKANCYCSLSRIKDRKNNSHIYESNYLGREKFPVLLLIREINHQAIFGQTAYSKSKVLH